MTRGAVWYPCEREFYWWSEVELYDPKLVPMRARVLRVEALITAPGYARWG
ncbi:MAG: hypothetical protein AB7W28_04160 [Armatimonadota bacterium]